MSSTTISNENVQSLVGLTGPLTFKLPQFTNTAPKSKMRATDLAGDSDGMIDTYGWDTVYAIKLPDVNSAITKYQQFPKTYNYTTSDNYTIQGTFDSWQMLTTGSAGAPWLDAHIPSGTLTDSGGNNYPYSDVDVVFQVQLAYLPTTGASSGTSGQKQNLWSSSPPPRPTPRSLCRT